MTQARLARWLTSVALLGCLVWLEVLVGSTFYRALTYDACRDLVSSIYYCLEMQRSAMFYTAAIRVSLIVLASIVLVLVWGAPRRSRTSK